MASALKQQPQGTVLEGLLCPMCYQDLGTIDQLSEHFQEAHSENHDILQSIKGFVGKAKRKILKPEISVDGPDKNLIQETSDPSFSAASNAFVFPEEPQEIGATHSHFSYFKKIRDTRLDRYAIETNKLLIRLDKLLTDIPADPDKRRDHERAIVMWISDSDVKLCPGCGSSFNITRRRHHCRLCGGVICQTCSEFLELTYARKLTNKTESKVGTLPLGKGFMQRRNSTSSLMSLVNIHGDPHIRVCHVCKDLLVRRDQQVEQRADKPIITQLYERMTSQMDEAEKSVVTFYDMLDSLNYGETTFTLEDAHILRAKISKLAENIELMSKRISILGTKDETQPSQKALQIQSAIRMAVIHFLNNTVVGLPSLPTEAELLKTQENLRIEKLQRIQQQQEKISPAHQKKEKPLQKTQSNNLNHVSDDKDDGKSAAVSEYGWTPQTANTKASDPLVQQMNNVRAYIKQAREAGKYDEVRSLESNLKDLQTAYLLMQHDKAPS